MIDDPAWDARERGMAGNRMQADSAQKPMETRMMRVRFLRSHRGYNQGEVARFDAEEADAYIRGQHAEPFAAQVEERAPVEAGSEKMMQPDDRRPKKGPGVITK